MPNIWIINKAGHPYHRALDKIPGATLRSFTEGRVNPLNFDRLLQDIAKGVAQYATEDDYILVCGTPILSAMVTALWLARFNQIRFLQWNAVRREYMISTTDKDDIATLLEREMFNG
jgi:hypothetical protein